MIAAAPATGDYRMDLDLLCLRDRISLVIVRLGMFALPEMVDLLRSGNAIADRAPLGQGWLHGVRDTLANWMLALRCSGISALIGAIPGIGGSVVDWTACGHAIRTTKERDNFGTGDIRSVIALKSANNATAGGLLLPTLLFGIPGSGSMAIFLAATILLTLQPGTAMPERNLDVTYTIVWSLARSIVIGTGHCVVLAPVISQLTVLRYPLIAPLIMLAMFFAAFQATRSLNDLLALLGIGLIGVLLRRFGWWRPAFLIGFVLASGAERYLCQAAQFDGWSFITPPVGLVILAVTLPSL
jgi:TctA family transporter